MSCRHMALKSRYAQRNTRSVSVLEPIVRVIEVPCGQEAAFNIFISEMNTWWPLGKYTTSAMDGQAGEINTR